jgi:dihydrofolate synthase/folylpolyglutamate synthase
VYDVRERFTVSHELPSWDDVAGAAEEIQAVVDDADPPTFFAVTTAMALVLARRAGTDVLVIEAGIGGRHDASNTFHRSDVLTVITAIGRDHHDVLGPTVDSIATEKAAVLRGRDWAVVGPQPDPVALRTVKAAGRVHGTRLLHVKPTGDWRTDAAATARAALRWFLPDVAALEPLRQPGRYEVYAAGERRWIFDGAHNPLKLSALAATVTAEAEPRVGIIAVGDGKELRGCATALAEVLDAAVVIEFAPPPGAHGPRSHPAEAVADALRRAGVDDVTVAKSATAAVEVVNDGPAATVVVAGSFLHLGAVRDALFGR